MILVKVISLSLVTRYQSNQSKLLDEVQHDSQNDQGRGLCYLLKQKAEAVNTNRGLDNFAIMRKLNTIIVLLYNYKYRSLLKVYDVSHAMARFCVKKLLMTTVLTNI